MKYPWLYVGAKVVCVDDRPGEYPTCSLRNGAVYSVAEIIDHPAGMAIKVSEADALSMHGFYLKRFRPLHDNSKTIGSIKQMMRDHVANASGGMGIRKPVSA